MEKKNVCWLAGIVLVLVAAIAGSHLIARNNGWHLEWSSKNGRFIWVDSEGKP
jgi:hypothetical protein